MNLSKPDPNDGQLVPLAHQEVRYRAAPTWTERCSGQSSAALALASSMPWWHGLMKW